MSYAPERLFSIAYQDSKGLVVANAQHDPQLSWSLTGVTFPSLTQSIGCSFKF